MNETLTNTTEFHPATVGSELPKTEAPSIVPAASDEALVQTEAETGEKDPVAVM